MTLQQLRYIMAVDKYRSFARAADHCGVTQPTLSKMVANLEEELDVRIFERTNKSVAPTDMGRKILAQASIAVMEAGRITEIVNEARGEVGGNLRLGVGPSIAPYILPKFIHGFVAECSAVNLSVEEMRFEAMSVALLTGQMDIGIAIGGHRVDGLLEIPLYEEPFWLYISEESRGVMPEFDPERLRKESMWVMKEAHCMRESAFSFCKARSLGTHIYEAGNIDTLIRVVDANGGYTIIPEMHLPLLSEQQRQNVHRLGAEYKSMRQVSMYIRHDYVREGMLNAVAEAIRGIIPAGMVRSRGRIRI
ncbi:MAG: LysR substrate-binding domain-containing protein [Muribaculaceae bacterium]|nr:LysR substrate-binding domain-containing protein [Muribaculaceae bacterium]